MFLNSSSGLDSQGLVPVRPQDSEFDFVVAERPEYIPGSGPPLAPISIMPAHNNTNGYILAQFENHGHPRYIVSYQDKPYLRVSVAPENILNWVSPRTFEEYEYKQTQLRAGNGKGKAKADPSQQIFEPRDEENSKQKGKPGRKRKHAVMEEGDGPSKRLMGPPSRIGRPRKSVEEPVFVSPQRPTLTSPSKQRGLADMVDTESEEDEELPTDIAIEAQLNRTMATRPRSRLGRDVSMSENSSPEPSRSSSKKCTAKQGLEPAPTRDPRSSSGQTRGSLSRSGSVSTTSNEAKRQRRSARNDSVATTSSREARIVHDDLERRNKKSPSKSFDQYSFLAKHKKKEKPAPEPEPDEEDEEDEGEGEFEVREIVEDEVLKVGKKQKPVTYYRIRWVGDWDLTREPAGNVGSEAIAEYKRKKALGYVSIAHLWYSEEGKKLDKRKGEIEPESLLVKPSKKRTKGGKGSDGADDESDPESFCDNPSKKSTRGLAAKFAEPARGEVIDDDDDETDDSDI